MERGMEAGAIKAVSYIGIQGWYAESRNEGYRFEGKGEWKLGLSKGLAT